MGRTLKAQPLRTYGLIQINRARLGNAFCR